MTEGAGLSQSRSWLTPLRSVLAVLGIALWFVCLVPPVAGWSSRYEFAQTIQYGVFAFCVPVLLAAGAPWRRLGLASRESHRVDDDGVQVSPLQPQFFDRIAIARTRATGDRRAISLAGIFIVLEIFWRVAPVVDYLATHAWLAFFESLSFVGAGVALFLSLIESPPLSPGTGRVYRIGISAAVMWTIWVIAYLDGMSQSSWYHAFHHVAGHGLSRSADQQFSSGSIWLISAVVFLPIVFWNLVHWLQSEEDPSDELYRMLRQERSRGFFGTA